VTSAATTVDSAPVASAASDDASTGTFGFAPLTVPHTTANDAHTTVPAMAPVPASGSATALADSALSASTAALSGATAANWSRLGHFKLYPLAGTGIDPLSNVVSTSLGGIPVSTGPVSQMVSDGLPINDLPMVGPLLSAPHAD
jgi:hypothetical protein